MTTFTVNNIPEKSLQKTNFESIKDFLEFGLESGLFSEIGEVDTTTLSTGTLEKIKNRKLKSNLISI